MQCQQLLTTNCFHNITLSYSHTIHKVCVCFNEQLRGLLQFVSQGLHLSHIKPQVPIWVCYWKMNEMLICCWLWFHLHSQSQTCPRGIVTCTLPVYSRVIKNLACINIPISALSAVLQNHTLAAREASDRGCVIALVANSPVLSGSKGLFNFLLYLRQQGRNKLITEIYCGAQCAYTFVYVCLYVFMWMHRIYPQNLILDPGIVMKRANRLAKHGFIC